jgi:hypothetical protein
MAGRQAVTKLVADTSLSPLFLPPRRTVTTTSIATTERTTLANLRQSRSTTQTETDRHDDFDSDRNDNIGKPSTISLKDADPHDNFETDQRRLRQSVVRNFSPAASQKQRQRWPKADRRATKTVTLGLRRCTEQELWLIG